MGKTLSEVFEKKNDQEEASMGVLSEEERTQNVTCSQTSVVQQNFLQGWICSISVLSSMGVTSHM